MLDNIWSFLLDQHNQAALAFVGGGIVVLAGGAWAVFKFIAARPSKEKASPTASATHGSVAIGGNMIDSKVDIHDRTKK